jgi:hypothetical protein
MSKLTRSNIFWRLSGKELQVANQLSFEEMVERHPVQTDAFAFTRKGIESMYLATDEDIETDSIQWK